MRVRKGVAARAVGIATSAVVVSLATAGAAAAAPAHSAASTASAQVENNTLIINGTAADDNVTLSPGTDLGHVVVNTNGSSDAFDVSTFNAVVVDLGNGNDAFTESPGILAGVQLTLDAGRGDEKIQTEDTTDVIFGQDGDDIISTGKGIDLIFAGNGDDFVDGGAGNDFAFLGQGKDVFQWDPGEGSDTIDGGAGHADVLLFNGANGSDVASLSANGHRSVFHRDPANITMDMDDVEQVDFEALGGTDTFTVNDLQGTDVRRVNVNVGFVGAFGDGFAGFADGVTDNVIVNGSDHADHVNVAGDGSTVDVAGLHAETTITGTDPGDQLHVNTQDGNDTVNVDASATAQMGVTTDLGADQH